MKSVNDDPDKMKKKRIKKMKQMISEKLKNVNKDDTSDSEQVDLSVELHPIRHYIDDKEEMLEQMFTSLGPTLIQNMLPPLLRTVPVYELKADCLIQLLGMSKKRIITVIEGKELESSSDSDVDSDSSNLNKEVSKTKNTRSKQQYRPKSLKKMKYIIDSETLDISINNEDDLESLSLSDAESVSAPKKLKSGEKHKKSKHKLFKVGNSSSRKDLSNSKNEINLAADISSEDTINESEKIMVSNGEIIDVNPKQGQTLLEILELEMRAKAIRSLLNQNSSSVLSEKEDNKEKRDNASKSESPPKIVEIMENKKVLDVIEIIDPEPAPKTDPESVVVEGSSKIKAEVGEQLTSPDSTNTAPDESCKNAEEPNEIKPPVTTSWSERYLENKETEKLIKTSKMCTNIRKRMRLVQSMKQLQKEKEKEKVEVPIMIGSISEYQKLVGSDNLTKQSAEAEVTTLTETSFKSDTRDENAGESTAKNDNKIDTSSASCYDRNDLGSSDVLEIDVLSTAFSLDLEGSSPVNRKLTENNSKTIDIKSFGDSEKYHGEKNILENIPTKQTCVDDISSNNFQTGSSIDKDLVDCRSVMETDVRTSAGKEIFDKIPVLRLESNNLSCAISTPEVISEESTDVKSLDAV